MDAIVVVGAGPTGLTAAMELSRFGVPVRLVERRTHRDPTSRALAVQSRTLELLDRRGPGPELERVGHRAVRAALYGAKGQLGTVEFGQVRSTHPFALLVPQSETERLLEQQVAQQGVAVERGTSLIAFADEARDDDGCLRVVLQHPDGAVEVVRASYLIDAGGAHSLVRHTLGLPFTGRRMPARYALGDVAVETDLPEDQLSIFLATNGFAAVFPYGAGRYRFIGTHGDGAEPAGEPDIDELQGLWDAAVTVPGRLHDLAWSSRFTISSRMLTTMRVGRVLLGGDAAHVHSPAGGQGMNTGIQDMVNLGWKLALVARGDAAPDLLDTYESERVPVIKNVVSTTERATSLVTSSSSFVHRAITTAATVALDLDQVQQVGSAVISETRANYRGSPLSTARATVAGLRAGDRVPTVAADGAAPLADLVDPTRLTLIVEGAAQAPFTTPWEHLIAVERVPDPRSGTESGLLLVRPDGYVAFSGDGTSGPALLKWLRRWFPVPSAA